MARPDPRSLPHPIRVMRIIARLNIGGPAVHVSLLTAGLNDGEFTSRLVTGVIGEAEGDMSYLAREMGVEPVVIPTMRREIEPLNDLRTLRALTRLMREFRPHVVHTHTAKAGFVGRLAARLTGVPVVVHTFHGHVFHGYFGPAKTRLFIELERLAARGSDVILTISERLRGDLLAYRIAPPEKIRVVPLGLPLDSLRDLDGLRGGLRRELGVSTDTQLVGIIGRLVPIKNHDLFLAAARRVREERPDTHFVIVGDGERRAELEALVQEMGLADAVTFTGWRDDLPGIYADLDVLVISSRNEGTPVSIIEAMAAGVPVVSTDVGGVADVLLGGELGRLTPPSDADALARGIVEALCEGRGPRTEAARTRAFEQYGAARLVEDMRALYRELLAGKGAPMRDGE
ncbi:MAG: glycosyltransferase family 4 protein [Chloroflexi bacterium]|nr:glycosyltransferase family 4 protein [Chloroflexota bacterium]